MSPNQYVSDLRAEVAALRAVVARVEALAVKYDRWGGYLRIGPIAADLREALSGDLRAETPTDSDPAATERQGEAGGAGDGV